eukprot:878565_1
MDTDAEVVVSESSLSTTIVHFNTSHESVVVVAVLWSSVALVVVVVVLMFWVVIPVLAKRFASRNKTTMEYHSIDKIVNDINMIQRRNANNQRHRPMVGGLGAEAMTVPTISPINATLQDLVLNINDQQQSHENSLVPNGNGNASSLESDFESNSNNGSDTHALEQQRIALIDLIGVQQQDRRNENLATILEAYQRLLQDMCNDEKHVHQWQDCDTIP